MARKKIKLGKGEAEERLRDWEESSCRYQGEFTYKKCFLECSIIGKMVKMYGSIRKYFQNL